MHKTIKQEKHSDEHHTYNDSSDIIGADLREYVVARLCLLRTFASVFYYIIICYTHQNTSTTQTHEHKTMSWSSKAG